MNLTTLQKEINKIARSHKYRRMKLANDNNVNTAIMLTMIRHLDFDLTKTKEEYAGVVNKIDELIGRIRDQIEGKQ